MSNLFKSTVNPKGATFFPVPEVLVKSALLRLMSAAQIKLYLFILYEAQRNSIAALSLSNTLVRKVTGLSPASLRRARTKLWEHGLIVLIPRRGACFLYVLLDPAKGEPAKAVPEKFREAYEKCKQSTTRLRAPSWSEL